jgi:hypothetical protein
MKEKGRAAHGERSPHSKLTHQQVADIRRRISGGERQIDLASEFGVSRSVVSCIHLRHTWRHQE